MSPQHGVRERLEMNEFAVTSYRRLLAPKVELHVMMELYGEPKWKWWIHVGACSSSVASGADLVSPGAAAKAGEQWFKENVLGK